MKETQPDELFAAWLHLPDGQRNEMDAEFHDIFELSCEKGFRAIIDEAEASSCLPRLKPGTVLLREYQFSPPILKRSKLGTEP